MKLCSNFFFYFVINREIHHRVLWAKTTDSERNAAKSSEIPQAFGFIKSESTITKRIVPVAYVINLILLIE